MKKYIDELIHLFLSSDFSEKTTREVQQWIADDTHREEKDAALSEAWHSIDAKADASTRRAFRQVMENVGVVPEKKIPFYRRPVWNYAAVFALLVASVVTTYFITVNHTENDVTMAEEYVSLGKTRTVLLPDGSKALLNSDSYILYPNNFKGQTRTVYLIGEANFKVQKNPKKPFIVRSGDLSVTALGTEFNVNAYPENEDIEATLLEGKVQVDCGEESYILTPGEQVVYNRLNSQSRKTVANPTDVTAWQRGEIVFRSCSISQVLQTLERRFGVKFQYKENMFDNDKFNFSFRKDASLVQVMNIMKIVTGKFTFKIEDNTCFLIGQN